MNFIKKKIKLYKTDAEVDRGYWRGKKQPEGSTQKRIEGAKRRNTRKAYLINESGFVSGDKLIKGKGLSAI